MKYKTYIFFFFYLITQPLWAQVESEEVPINFPNELQGALWSNPRYETKSMEELSNAYCSLPVSNRSHHQRGVRRCMDGSISFIQPDSTGINGWEGKCGQTAAANLIYFYCKMALHPSLDMDDFFRDIGPGVTPLTLKNGLNEIFSNSGHVCPRVGEWKRKAYGNADSYVSGISKALSANVPFEKKLLRKRNDGTFVKRTPVAVLIYTGGGILHWVTVIDILKKGNDCRVVYQEYGMQKEVKCSELTYSSYKVGLYYAPILSSFTVVQFDI